MAPHTESASPMKPNGFGEATSSDWPRLLAHYTLERARLQDRVANRDEEKWKAVQRQFAARNLFLFDELRRILQIFNARDIRVIVLKGAALAERVYPHLGLRIFDDIDLLIYREKIPQALEILSSLGYRPYFPQLRSGVEDFQAGVTYVKQGESPIMMDIHWALGPPYPYFGRLDMDGLWERARKAKIAGADTLVLCPEDFLLHLCLHLAKHSQTSWLPSSCDIVQLTYHYGKEFDWQTFLSRVFESKVSLPVQYALQKTSELLKAPIPLHVLEQLAAYKPSRFERQILAVLTSSRNQDGEGIVLLIRLLTIPGIALELRYIWTVLIPSRDYMLSRYTVTNPRLLPFYYLLRMKDGILMALNAFSVLLYPGVTCPH